MRLLGTRSHTRTYDDLVAAYAQPHRHYHTAAHIEACLGELDAAEGLAQVAYEVEVALWFHDAVYVPGSSDNERLSAEWAVRFLVDAGIPESSRDTVHEHIMATCHDAEPAASDSALVVDIDLSIFGQAPAAYSKFERDVREEYRFVPLPVYARTRRGILTSFLERPAIYRLPHFRARYESVARRNLETAIRVLRHSSP